MTASTRERLLGNVRQVDSGCWHRWQVEVMGWAGKSERPDVPSPTSWVCDKHLGAVMDRWT